MNLNSSLARVALLLGAVALPALAADAASRTRTVYRPLTCQGEVGRGRAADLVSQCVGVSPGQPACNAGNTCATISGEIKRGCLSADDDETFPFCAAFNVDRDDDE